MRKDVKFKSEDLVLSGTLFTPEKESFGGAVFYHGSGSSRKNYLPIAESLLEKGIASLCFDFRGCGESEGNYEASTVNDTVVDGNAALDFFLQTPGLKKQNVGLVGVSRGGHVAAMVTADHKDNIISLVLRAPVAYPQKIVDKRLDETMVKNFLEDKDNWEDSPALTAMEKFENYLLIVASEKDDLVPFEMLEQYHQRSRAAFTDIQLIRGAGHNLGESDSEYRDEFKKLVVDWFTREG